MKTNSISNAININLPGRYLWLVLSLIIFGVLVISCSKSDETPGIMVSIKNTSNYDYSNITLYDQNFGNLTKGSKSGAIHFDKVYKDLAYVSLYINDVKFVLQPIDYDAPELKSGSCTFLINVVDINTQSLTLTTQTK